MEIEPLQAIYMDEIRVIRPDGHDKDASTQLVMSLLPATANVKTEQHVKLTLTISIGTSVSQLSIEKLCCPDNYFLIYSSIQMTFLHLHSVKSVVSMKTNSMSKLCQYYNP